MSPRRAPWVSFIVAVIAALAFTSPASAAPPTTGYTCETKGLTGSLLGIPLPLEALSLVGSGDIGEPCVDDETGPLNQILAILNPLGINLDALHGETSNQPTRGVSEQEPVARTEVTDLGVGLTILTVPLAGILQVDAIESRAAARCVAGVQTLESSYNVDGVSILGGAPILNLTEPVEVISDALNLPLVQLIVRLYPGEEVKTADSVTRRALRVEVVTRSLGVETPAVELTVGESRVDVHGTPCDPATAPTLGVPDAIDRVIGADVTAPEGTTITACEFTITPDGGTAQTLAGTYAGGRCTAPLPAADFPVGDYSATVSATTATGGTGTSGPGTFTLGGPTVGTPAIEGGQVVVPVGPGDGGTVTGCTITITPKGGGAAIPLTATYDSITGRCVADLPADLDPGDYDVDTEVTDSNGDSGTGTGEITIPAGPVAPELGTPVRDGDRVVVPVTPGTGGVLTCEITVKDSGDADVAVTGVTYDPVRGACVGDLPADIAPGDYGVDAKVSDGTLEDTAAGTITVPAPADGPTVGDPEIEDGKVVVPVTPGDGATVEACEITVTPAGGGDPVPVTDVRYDADTESCVGTLPDDLAPGDYDVDTKVTDSNGDEATGSGTITIPAVPVKPDIAVGTPIAIERAVGAPVEVPAGVTVASCTVAVTPRGGGAEITVDGTFTDGWCVAYLAPAQFPDGEYDIVVRVTDADDREFTGAGPVTVASFVAPAPTPTPTPIPTPTPDPGAGVAGAALQCESRQVVLTDVRRSGSRVRLAGAADRAHIGKTVQLRFLATGKVVARAKVGKDGLFSATAKRPAKRYLRSSSKTRYQARVAGKSSKALRLVRRMNFTSVRRTGNRIRFKGRASAPRITSRQTVVLKRRVGCGSWKTIGRVKLTSSGRFTKTVADGQGDQAAAYRADTRVRAQSRKRSAVRTYTLPRYVAAR
ncbi:MAG: hypothetical protein AB7G37_07285 [Solirubrobacteraceae bacterium]